MVELEFMIRKQSPCLSLMIGVLTRIQASASPWPRPISEQLSQYLDWSLDLGSFQKYSRWHSSLVSGEWLSDTCIWVKAGLILVVKCTINLCHPWRSLGGGHDNPLQYSCLGNLMDRGAWWATLWVCKELATTEWLNSSSSSLPLSMSYELLQQSPVAS